MRNYYPRYWVLFVFIFLKILILPFFLPSGGVTSDSIDYFRIADDLPKVNSDLFPLGYPLLLKLFNLFTQDYFYSSRLISILSVLSIGLFSYFKNFYFRETVIFFTFRIFSIFLFSYSEGSFLTLEYFLIYYFHEYFSQKIKGWKFVLPASLIMVFLIMIRYSGLYIYVAIGLFFLYYTLKNRKFNSIFKQSYFYFLLFSALGIFSYLLYNYMNFQDFSGEKARGGPIYTDFWAFTYSNLLGMINIVNPVISTKVWFYNLATQIIAVIIILIDLLSLFIFIRFYRKFFKNGITYFHQLLLTIGGVYLLLMIFSEYTQNIEELSSRMLCEASFAFFFSFLILYFKYFSTKIKWMYLLGVFSLIFSFFNIVKIPSFYWINRGKVEKAIENRGDIKYFYDDTKERKTTAVIYIPLINKEIEYINVHVYSGYFNRYILNTINPSVRLIVNDQDIQNKSEILYNSDIK